MSQFVLYALLLTLANLPSQKKESKKLQLDFHDVFFY